MQQNRLKIITADRKQYLLTAEQSMRLETAMENKDQFFKLDRFTIINIPRDIMRIEKALVTEVETRTSRQLPEGKHTFNPKGKGYQTFLAARKKLADKLSVRRKA